MEFGFPNKPVTFNGWPHLITTAPLDPFSVAQKRYREVVAKTILRMQPLDIDGSLGPGDTGMALWFDTSWPFFDDGRMVGLLLLSWWFLRPFDCIVTWHWYDMIWLYDIFRGCFRMVVEWFLWCMVSCTILVAAMGVMDLKTVSMKNWPILGEFSSRALW